MSRKACAWPIKYRTGLALRHRSHRIIINELSLPLSLLCLQAGFLKTKIHF